MDSTTLKETMWTKKQMTRTDKRYIILEPSVKTNRTPCFDTTLPSTCTCKEDQNRTIARKL